MMLALLRFLSDNHVSKMVSKLIYVLIEKDAFYFTDYYLLSVATTTRISGCRLSKFFNIMELCSLNDYSF